MFCMVTLFFLSVKQISSHIFIIIMPHRYCSFYSENIVLYVLTVKQDYCNTLEICIFLNNTTYKKENHINVM